MNDLIERLERDQDSHKGDNGYVGVIAGSSDYSGAPALVSDAALRTGCDLTRILTSKSVCNIVSGYSPDFIVDSYAQDYFSRKSLSKAEKLVDWSDAVVIGPGLGKCEKAAVRQFVDEASTPLVVDADAVEPCVELDDLSHTIFTPHSGESEKIKTAHGSIGAFVEETDAVVVEKGRVDTIYTPDEVFRNDTGCAAMTTGGTGDVLTGVIAGLIVQGLDRTDAARLGAWLNGKAGERVQKRFGNGLKASDLPDVVAEILAER
jgi:hydroxyethylthiazole kinase-like uncharacterized protein yjeF